MHGPIRVITVEREYGSHGAEFAHDLATGLGWKLYDSELVTGAARAAGVPEKRAAELDDRLDPWYYRYGKVFWQDSMYYSNGPCDEQVFDCERMYALIRKEIVDAAKAGNCVLVGRGSAFALAGQPGASTSSCTPRWRPSGTGLRRCFLTRRIGRSTSWQRRTSAAPQSSSASITRSGARAAAIICC